MIRPSPGANGSLHDQDNKVERGGTTEEHLDVPPKDTLSRLERLTIIQASAGWRILDWRELIEHRDLLGFLIWRDVKVRYKQAALGCLWAVIQPIMTMIAFVVFFGRFGGMDQRVGRAYPLFVLAGLLPWQLFSSAVAQASSSLIVNGALLRKVYFPRLIIPVAATGSALVDFGVSLVALLVLSVGYQAKSSHNLLLLPLFVMGTLAAATAIGVLLSAMVVMYRDFLHVVPFMLQIWLFISPIAYPLAAVPERYRALYCLNPMVGMVEGLRASVMGNSIPWWEVTVSLVVSVATFVAALLYFNHVERRLADVI